MGYIDKKIQEIVKEIVAKEFEEATRLENTRRQARSFDSHLSAIKNHTKPTGSLAPNLNLGYRLDTIQLFN